MRKTNTLIALIAAFAVMFGGVSPASAATKYRAPKGLQAHNVKTPTALMVWKKAKGAQRYRVVISTKPTMKGAKSYKTKGSTPKAKVKNLKAGRRYYVKVRSLNKKGKARSAYSKRYTFVTQSAAKPAAPTGLSVAERKAQSITVRWNKVGAATSYRLYYRRGTDAQKVAVTGDVNSMKFSGLVKSTAYSFSIASVDAYGTVSPLSRAVGATTRAFDLDAPTGVKVTGSKATSMSVSWNGVANALKYRVVFSGTNEPPRTMDVTGTFATLTGLTASTEYIITVKAIDGDGQHSNYSAAVAASTYAYDLASPGWFGFPVADSAAMTVTWETVPHATGYVLYYKAASGEAWTPVEVGSAVAHLSWLSPGTAYNFKVVAKNAEQVSDDSAIVTKATRAYDLQAPTGVGFGGSSSSTITVHWDPTPHATEHFVYWQEGGSADNPWNIVRVSGANYHTLRGLTSNRTYRFYVVASDGDQTRRSDGNVSIKTKS